MICRHRQLQQGLSSSSLQRYFVLVGCIHQVFMCHKSCLYIPSFSIWFSFEIKAGVVTHSWKAITCESGLQHGQLPWTLWFLGFGSLIFPFVFPVVLHITLLCEQQTQFSFTCGWNFVKVEHLPPQNQPQNWSRRHMTTPKAEHCKRKGMHQILPGNHSPGWRHPEVGSNFWRMHWLSYF